MSIGKKERVCLACGSKVDIDSGGAWCAPIKNERKMFSIISPLCKTCAIRIYKERLAELEGSK